MTQIPFFRIPSNITVPTIMDIPTGQIGYSVYVRHSESFAFYTHTLREWIPADKLPIDIYSLRVKSIKFSVGATQLRFPLSQGHHATIHFSNVDNALLNNQLNSSVRLGTLVSIYLIVNGQKQQRFCGRITKKTFVVSNANTAKRELVLVVSDFMTSLQHQTETPVIATNETISQYIRRVVDFAVLGIPNPRFRYNPGQIGITDGSITSRMIRDRIPDHIYNYDQTSIIFPYTGTIENPSNVVLPSTAQIIDPYLQTGEVRCYYHDPYYEPPTQTTFDNDTLVSLALGTLGSFRLISSNEYINNSFTTINGNDTIIESYDLAEGGLVISGMRVGFNPKVVTGANELLYTFTSLSINPGETRMFGGKYTDPADRAVTINAINPLLTYNISDTIITGVDRSSDVRVFDIEMRSTDFTFSVTNNTAEDILFINDIQVRGVTLKQYELVFTEIPLPNNIQESYRKVAELRLPQVPDFNQAVNVGLRYLQIYGNDIARISQVVIYLRDNSDVSTLASTLKPFDNVRISLYNGLSTDHYHQHYSIWSYRT